MAQSKASIQARLDLYYKAEAAIVGGAQRYEIEDKVFQKADLADVQTMIKGLESQLGGSNPNVKRMRTQRVLHKRY